MESQAPDRNAPDPHPTNTSRPRVSPQRQRAGRIAAVVVVIVLGLTLWQTKDYWMPPEDAALDGNNGRGIGGPPRGMGGPPGGMPAQQDMARRFKERIKAALEPTDAEWATLEPKIDRVTKIQDELRPRGGGMGRPPGAGPSRGEASELTEKTEFLRAAVDDEQTTPDALAANLASAREARSKLKVELQAAQDELRKGLTPRREAALTLMGVLD